MNFQIGDFFLGYTDGEEEYREDDFLNLFYSDPKVIEQVLLPRNYYVLGRKGSGKTVLSYFLMEKFRNPTQFVSRHSLGELTPQLFSSLHNTDNSGETLAVLKWAFYLELTKLVLQNQSLSHLEEYSKLDKILKSFNQGKNSLFENLKTIIKGVSISVGPVKIDPNKYLDHTTAPILLLEIEELLKPLLSISGNLNQTYLLLIDDVDNHLTFYNGGRKTLLDLIYSVFYLNNFIRNSNRFSKCLLFIRSEVFFQIRDHNYNKLNDDHSFKIRWGGFSFEESNLFDLIAHKIKARHSEFTELSTVSIMRKLFVDTIYFEENGKKISRPTDKFILERTFYRPRDIIRLIKFAQEKYPYAPNFESYILTHVSDMNAVWLKNEVESELYIHYEKDFVKKLFEIVSKPNSPVFGFNRLCNYYKYDKTISKSFIEEALRILYRFNVIGQIWTDYDGRRHIEFSFSSFGYDKPEEPNFLINNFIIHNGLRPALLRHDYYKYQDLNKGK